MAVDDEDLAGGDLLHVLVEGGAGGGELVNAEVGIEGESGVVEAHVESGAGGEGGLKEGGGGFFVGGGGVEEGRAEALAKREEGQEENDGEEDLHGLAERLVGQGGEEGQSGAGEEENGRGERKDVAGFLVGHEAEEEKSKKQPEPEIGFDETLR